mgnify:CR=1 FL=1
MSDSLLKKQFQKRDVERLRNLIKGKTGEKTTSGIGYNGEESISYKEGDIWEADGKTWTIRDGIKENVTKLDKFKNVAVPIFCPKCKQNMDGQLDPYYYKEIDINIEEYKNFMADMLSESNNSFITEAGDIQKWDGGINKKRANSALEEGIKYFESLKKK